jgi:hypothetical protein
VGTSRDMPPTSAQSPWVTQLMENMDILTRMVSELSQSVANVNAVSVRNSSGGRRGPCYQDLVIERGLVRPSNSPWSSPIVLAPKKDGDYRFCVDFRRVNSVTKRDALTISVMSKNKHREISCNSINNSGHR